MAEINSKPFSPASFGQGIIEFTVYKEEGESRKYITTKTAQLIPISCCIFMGKLSCVLMILRRAQTTLMLYLHFLFRVKFTLLKRTG